MLHFLHASLLLALCLGQCFQNLPGLSTHPYMDSITSVVHPSTVRAINNRYELMVLGGGPFVLGNQNDGANLSAAMYIEPTTASIDLGDYRGMSAAELRLTSDPTAKRKFGLPVFCQQLTAGRFDRAIRVQVKGETSVNAFYTQLAEQLKPHLQEQFGTSPSALEEINYELGCFKNMLPLDDLMDGDEILFSVVHAMDKEHFAVAFNGHFDPNGLQLLTDHPELQTAFFRIFTEGALGDRFADRAPMMWNLGTLDFLLTPGHIGAYFYDGSAPSNFELDRWYQGVPEREAVRLIGMGKLKTNDQIVNSNLGTVALYVDEDLVPSLRASPFEDLPGDVMRPAIVWAKNSKAAYLQLSEEVTGASLAAKLWAAMEEKLIWLTDDDIAMLARAKQIFVGTFPLKIYKDENILFYCTADDRLLMGYNDQPWNLVTESSPLLCTALFDALLVSKDVVNMDIRLPAP